MVLWWRSRGTEGGTDRGPWPSLLPLDRVAIQGNADGVTGRQTGRQAGRQTEPTQPRGQVATDGNPPDVADGWVADGLLACQRKNERTNGTTDSRCQRQKKQSAHPSFRGSINVSLRLLFLQLFSSTYMHRVVRACILWALASGTSASCFICLNRRAASRRIQSCIVGLLCVLCDGKARYAELWYCGTAV
ncbi:hypothetical protein BKA80DRAFT_120442 [Phyllosticta citrichinensis]